MKIRLPGFGTSTLTLLVSLWLLAVDNVPFWRTVWSAIGGLRADNVLFVLALPVFALAWTFLLLSLITWGRATKPVLCVVLLISAAISYFANTYGVLIDRTMIANIVQTDPAEALDLVSWGLAAWLLLSGVLPAAAIVRMRAVPQPWTGELMAKGAGILAAALCLGIAVFSSYQNFASLLRNHREIRLMLAPYNAFAAVHSYLGRQFAGPTVVQVIGADAARTDTTPGKPALTLLVIGETARAENFSFNGYARSTNPELARRNVLYFSNVSSCGTSTAVSLPCMFLDVGRGGFEDSLALRREGLLDVLKHAGVAVLWRDNNSGCKGVCDRVPNEDLSNLPLPALCSGGECFDEVLLHGLQDYLDKLDRDAVIVLHMKGSHGPAYFKRYPPAFAEFKPACENVQLDRCSRESIVNAYDNTLRYSDHVLGLAIDLLKANSKRFDAGMLYVSDHGESLGEKGLYLHGVPYALAPREQTHVPMVLWLSEGLRERRGINIGCLEARRGEPLSHDNLFHTVLGLAAVRTSVYQPERDFLRACRS
ncbi:MAG TPA: phosphoethanolamine--lipid A transferase [Burkholderiales bacterium]|nr:phosphoethanolamine--lipid A transferase [Burkholderiales bacterium]